MQGDVHVQVHASVAPSLPPPRLLIHEVFHAARVFIRALRLVLKENKKQRSCAACTQKSAPLVSTPCATNSLPMFLFSTLFFLRRCKGAYIRTAAIETWVLIQRSGSRLALPPSSSSSAPCCLLRWHLQRTTIIIIVLLLSSCCHPCHHNAPALAAFAPKLQHTIFFKSPACSGTTV